MSMYIMLDVFDMMTEILGEKENQKQSLFNKWTNGVGESEHLHLKKKKEIGP